MNDNINPLSQYIPMVEYIAGVMGPNCEVVLHDVNKVENSIVAIKNNHISGREVGGFITNLGLKFIKEKAYEKQNYFLNYTTTIKDGKILRSSTYFIKSNEGKLLGLLCINVDISEFLNVKKLIDRCILGGEDKAIEVSHNKELSSGESEHFAFTIEDMIKNIINDSIAKLDVPPERLSPDEKINLIHELEEKGIFMLKGTVSEIANLLKVSENTVYRYLNKRQ